MNVQIRPLSLEDIGCVIKIERQAFPTIWPSTPFKRELDNRLAKYLVAWEPMVAEAPLSEKTGPGEPVNSSGKSIFGRILGAVKGRLTPERAATEPNYSILGFVGLWFMVEEAHITSIAVEEASQGKGIGELLLMSSIELAMKRGADEVSLEARISNHVAQSLYEKYSFRKVGIRKGYYTDNWEDAVIMTTQPINTQDYREKFQALKEAYIQRHGEVRIALV